MKKGISPLMATVIIIGLVVAIAAMVILFGKEFVQKSTQRVDVESEEKIICMEDVNFEIRSACYLNPSRLKMLVFNTEKKDIRKFHVRFYESPDTVTEIQKKQTIRAGEAGVLEFTVESADIKEVQMFPSIRHRFRTLVCSIDVVSYGNSYSENPLGPCTS